MIVCSVCKVNQATQKHHLNYDPEITIDICIPCHQKVHGNGVGRPSKNKKSVDRPVDMVSEELLWSILFRQNPELMLDLYKVFSIPELGVVIYRERSS